MRRLSLKKMFGGFLIFASAAILGAALTPEEGSARGPCDNMKCENLDCEEEARMYCHDYADPEIGCWYGWCEGIGPGT